MALVRKRVWCIKLPVDDGSREARYAPLRGYRRHVPRNRQGRKLVLLAQAVTEAERVVDGKALPWNTGASPLSPTGVVYGTAYLCIMRGDAFEDFRIVSPLARDAAIFQLMRSLARERAEARPAQEAPP